MDEEGLELHYRTCPLCEATCGLEIAHRDGQVVRIRGDRDDPFSKGYICPKGTTLGKLHDDPDRLRTPLVRVDGELRPATWDEAFEAVAEGLGRIWAGGDRNAVALYLGNPNAHTVAGAVMGRPLITALGTQNLFSASTVDQMAMHASAGHMFGNPNAIAVPDLDRTDYLLMLGANPLESNGSLCTAPDFPGRLDALRERGGRLVVVDPRRTKTAKIADEHLAIRPGSDAMWLAAIVTEVARADRIDLGAVDGHVRGLDEALATLAPFDADTVAAATSIDADTTRRIARELCDAPTAACYSRIGTQTTPYGTLASWLTDVVSLVSGNLDSPGGAMFPASAIAATAPSEPRAGRGFRTGRWTSRVKGYPEVRGELPVATLADEIGTPGDGQVRALITVAGNPVLSCPNSDRLDAALAGLEFMVSVDIYLNETTRHADVILPAPSALAKQHLDLAFMSLSVRNYVNYSPPLHPPDAPSEPGMAEHDILARLALIASGLGAGADPSVVYDLVLERLNTRPADAAPVDTEPTRAPEADPMDEILDVMLRAGGYPDLDLTALRDNPHGLDLGALRPNLAGVLRTESAAIEAGPPALLADVARLRAALDHPPPPDQLLLVGRRHLRSNNSWMHNIDVLTKGRARCTLQMHPTDAGRLGCTDAGVVAVTSPAGCVRATVEVTDEIAPGTVSLPHGWGHAYPGTAMANAEANAGVNTNVLTTDDVVDPLSGTARLNAIPVTVAPAG